MDAGQIVIIITAFLGSGTISAGFAFANARVKIDAENQILLAEARKINVETDISLIDQLTELNVTFFDRVTVMDGKIYDLEDKLSKRKTAEVDLEIRVKRLEAELEHTLGILATRDELILQLQRSLDECRKKLKEKTEALEDCLGTN